MSEKEPIPPAIPAVTSSSVPQALAESVKVGLATQDDTINSETPKQITDRLNPSVSLRLLIMLSFPLVLLLGVPYWWHTTSITRLPLPEDQIAALENAQVRLYSALVRPPSRPMLRELCSG